MSKLDQLNAWLAKEADAHDFPSFRRKIDTSGANLSWLRKALKKIDAPAEIKALAALEIKELVK